MEASGAVNPSVRGGRGGGRGRNARLPKPSDSGQSDGGKGRGRGDGGNIPQGSAGGKYNVVGLVAFSGQNRPAFLENCARVPLPAVPLHAIPAFPNPLPRPAAAAVAGTTSGTDTDRSSHLSASFSALSLTADTVLDGDCAKASSVGDKGSQLQDSEKIAALPSDTTIRRNNEGIQAYQDMDSNVIYLFLPYPEPELGVVSAEDSYYSLEQQMFRWESQVFLSEPRRECLQLYFF